MSSVNDDRAIRTVRKDVCVCCAVVQASAPPGIIRSVKPCCHGKADKRCNMCSQVGEEQCINFPPEHRQIAAVSNRLNAAVSQMEQHPRNEEILRHVILLQGQARQLLQIDDETIAAVMVEVRSLNTD